MAPRATSDDFSRLLAIVIAVVVIAALYLAKVILLPLALGILLAFVLNPAVRLLERAHLGRALSAIVVMVLTLAVVGGVGYVVTRQFADVLNRLPQYQSNLQEKIDSLKFSSPALKNASDVFNELSKAWVERSQEDAADEAANSSGPAQPLPVQVITPPKVPVESVTSVLQGLLQALIVIVLTMFMLIQRERVRNRLISLAGQRRLIAMTRAMDESDERVSRYLRSLLTVNACYGALIGGGLHFIGLPGALLWGVLVGVLRFLPYVGPPLGAVMPVLLSFAVFHGWEGPLLTIGLFVAIELIASYLIEPKWYGTQTGVFPMALVLAAIFWAFLWGPIGLVLSTPLTVCLVVLGRYLPHLNFLSLLLGDAPALEAETRVYQRLLAMDQEEAERVLEELLAKQSLTDVYDSVLLPVMNAAEQDRYQGRIDEAAESVVCQGVREVVEYLFERYRKDRKGWAPSEALPATEIQHLSLSAKQAPKVLCVPARDEADEVVGIMLAQLLVESGYDAAWVSAAPQKEIVQQIDPGQTDIVCISALSPFVISHARSFYRAFRTNSPQFRVVVGLWSFPGDAARVARRIGLAEGVVPVTTLRDAVGRVSQLSGTPAGQVFSPARA